MGLFSKHDSVITTESGIHVEDIRADVPQFKRVYTAKLDNRASIKIEIKTFIGNDRYYSGELTQPNGRWILFDPKAIADKILDPVLLPIIKKYTDEIIALDKTYIKSDPNEFMDEKGQKWKRQ